MGGLSPIYLSVAPGLRLGGLFVRSSSGGAPKDQTTAIRSPGPCAPFRRFRSPCTPHVFCGDARSAAEQAPTPPMPALLFATQPLRLDQLPASAFGPNPPALRIFSVASTRSYDCCREHAASPNPRPAVSSVDPKTALLQVALLVPSKNQLPMLATRSARVASSDDSLHHIIGPWFQLSMHHLIHYHFLPTSTCGPL